MDCLEFGNLQQLIYTDLARNIAESHHDPGVDSTIELVKASVVSTDESGASRNDGDAEGDDAAERPFMPASRVQCHIGYANITISLPNSHAESTFPVLLDILRDVPYIDFDQSLMWDEWSLPDQLVYATVSALLQMASLYPEYRAAATACISEFASRVINQLKTAKAFEALTQAAPAFHGFYRAIITTSFHWSLQEWDSIATELNSLFAPDVVDHLNSLFSEALQETNNNSDGLLYLRVFITRYISQNRPLSGYFMICCCIETLWTVLAQTFVPQATAPTSQPFLPEEEAAAANKIWLTLMRKPVPAVDVDETLQDTLRVTIGHAMTCFMDLLVQIESMDSEPSLETYAWETISESLKLASVCSVARHEMDTDLYARLQLLLSDDSPVSDPLVQEAALKSTTVLVHNFPGIATHMSTHLRRFVTSPLPIFEFEFASESKSPPPLAAAAKCLASCIKLAPGDDFIMSNMYSLLNYIAATGKEAHDGSSSLRLTTGSLAQLTEQSTLHSVKSGLQGFSDDQKRLIGISTISVVTCLALEFKIEEVTRLTISMLLQRLRTAEPAVEAAIAYSLVDLAIISPEPAFLDIIKAFSIINRTANPDDPRFSNNVVMAAQTRLAQELRRKPSFSQTYLVELLTLFIDKGVAIQNASIANPQLKIDDLVEQLGALLLPIDALLSHRDFTPHIGASKEIVALFRNLWFLCVLFGFTDVEGKEGSPTDWQLGALTRIASKTPHIVLEEIQDYVTSDLEYNAVIRQEFAHTAIAKHRAALNKMIPSRYHESRYISPGQIVFLLAMHALETRRSSIGLPSSLPTYFVNASVNRHVSLAPCMETLAEKIMTDSIQDMNKQIVQHSLPEEVFVELQTLLTTSCHRVLKVRDIASRYMNKLITNFPSIMCNSALVFAIIEVLSMLRQACEGEYTDECDPVFDFHSERSGISLRLSDSYKTRNEILSNLHRNAQKWFSLALARAPLEFQTILEKYLSMNPTAALTAMPEMGASFALQFASALGPAERKISGISGTSNWTPDRSRNLTGQISCREYFAGAAIGNLTSPKVNGHVGTQTDLEIKSLKRTMVEALGAIQDRTFSLSVHDTSSLLFRSAAVLLSSSKCDYELLHYIVALPFEIFSSPVISAGIDVWMWLMKERPAFEVALLTEINASWTASIKHRRGIFSQSIHHSEPFNHPIEYNPTDKHIIDRGVMAARKLVSPHEQILQLLLSRFQAARYQKPGLMILILRLVLRSALAHPSMSTHPLTREARFSFLLFGLDALKSSRMDVFCEHKLREALYAAAFSWFSVKPQWTYGANRIQVDADIKVLKDFLSLLQDDNIRGIRSISSLSSMVRNTSITDHASRLKHNKHLLRLLIDNELYKLTVWQNPSADARHGVDHDGLTEKRMHDDSWISAIRTAWGLDPAIAIHLPERFKQPVVEREVAKWVRAHTRDVLDTTEALGFVLGQKSNPSISRDLKYILLWKAVPPVIAVTYFSPTFGNDPALLQYAHRVLEEHPVSLTFFFVPQIVQALRNDSLGYVQHFIFETAKISQLFCHQIIWNMKANRFRGDNAEVQDPMKPKLDTLISRIVECLSGEARDFYDREFSFFNEVTSISGKLKDYIKRSKAEKKAKIDEEMAKIVVEQGVYLPSNPDGVVVDIDKKSGRPLQSHAKAPFMATFKVRKERIVAKAETPTALADEAAIFKVGDDCRQDVLALQVIAMFKNIFMGIGLNLYLFPYRVTATEAGCGIIDVVPNATSRDEMGRAKINDLMGFFTSRYGGEDTIAFQRARLNFIQSMAAYSVACYILQIKDRHNGNIMIDGEGHIVHIDFGFLFDIGGIKFEPNSFKLNHEMVTLMGGRSSEGYMLFHSLTIKAFLAIRPHVDQIVSTVELMLGTELPSFKGEPTIKRLRDRFVPSLNDRQAAEWMVGVIKNAHENMRSIAYDEFQRLQNGIPYK